VADRDQVLELLRTRQGFLSHFTVALRRRGADGSLHVACDFATEGAGRRHRLFDMPLEAADAWWSELLGETGAPSWLEESCPGGEACACVTPSLPFPPTPEPETCRWAPAPAVQTLPTLPTLLGRRAMSCALTERGLKAAAAAAGTIEEPCRA
jgi:hypothetical protein